MEIEITYGADNTFFARYYAYLIARTYRGWYQQRRFLILPQWHEQLVPWSVVLPDTEMLYHKEWLQLCDAFPENVEMAHIDQLPDLDQVETYVTDTWKDTFEDTSQITSIVHDVFRLYDDFFDLYSGRFHIQIVPTKIGPRASFFSYPDTGEELPMTICWRRDAGISALVYGVVNCLILQSFGSEYEREVHDWRVRQEIGEFLVHHSRLKKYLDIPLTGTSRALVGNADFTQEDWDRSQQYLQTIGFPSLSVVSVDWGRMKTIFSEHELLFAQALFDRRGDVLSYDQLSDVLYGESADEKFSLQYLAKVIEGVRKKLSREGVKNVIVNQRGKGYGWMG